MQHLRHIKWLRWNLIGRITEQAVKTIRVIQPSILQSCNCHIPPHRVFTIACCSRVAWRRSTFRNFPSKMLSPGVKERIGVVFEVVKTSFHWGFIPTLLYLGKNTSLHNNLFCGVFLRMRLLMKWANGGCFVSGFRKGSEPGMPPLQLANLLW